MKSIIYNQEFENHLVQFDDFKSISVENKENPFLIMSNLKDCNELHLLAHGSPGNLDLGTGIDTKALYENAEYLASLNVQKIILWGCHVGKDTEFIKTFSKFTNAEVYASKDYLGKNKGMSNDFPLMNDFIKGLLFYLGEPEPEPESEQEPCPGDVPGDGNVNVSDLLKVIENWGKTSGNADINEDNIVNVTDLLGVISAWCPEDDSRVFSEPEPPLYTKHDDILYKTRPDGVKLYLDAYIPNTGTIHNAIMYIHGGAFVSGTEENQLAVAMSIYMAERGYAVFSIQYSFSFYNPFSMSQLQEAIDKAVVDAFDAMQFIKDSDIFNVYDKIFLAGYSAGAITSLNMGINTNPLVSSINGIISVAGSLYDKYTEITLNVAPIMLWHGDADLIVPYYHATRINNWCNSIGKDIIFYTLENIGHSAIISAKTPNDESVFTETELFIETILSTQEPESEPEPCVGDLDGNNIVNVTDLLKVIENWGNITDDGFVDVSDLLEVIGGWGPCT